MGGASGGKKRKIKKQLKEVLHEDGEVVLRHDHQKGGYYKTKDELHIVLQGRGE